MLIGRSSELAAIGAVLDGLPSGNPFVVSFVGDEGSGRSSLLDAATQHARAAGALVLAARGSGVEPGPAYGALLALLRPLESDLDDLAGAEHAAAVQSALAIRADAVDALDVGVGVLRVLAGAAESQPVVLVLDDAATLDAASAAAISFVLARVGVDPIGAFLGMPTGPSALDDLVTRRVVLGPLGVTDLAAIVEHATACGPVAARACAEWAAGSPMLAVELASSLSDDERTGRSALPAVPRATVRAVERLQRGLDVVSERARHALVVVAASRSGRVTVILRALAALGEPAGGLDEAEDAGHVSLTGGVASFTHPLLQPLSYHLVAASSRRAAHRALAGALVEPREAVERAWHLAEGCVGPDDDVAAALDLVAADSRRRGALVDAAATLERAAALSVAPEAATARRRAAAVAALDGFDFDTALRLVDVADPDDEESSLLAIEAIERRDGESAALAAVSTRATAPAEVLADLLLGTGRRADAARQLESAADSTLTAAVRAALDPTSPLGDEPDAATAIDRRALRRWLHAAASRDVAVARPTSVDELVGAAHVAGARGDAVTARDLVERAVASLPKGATRLMDSLQAVAKRFDDVAVTASSVPAAILDTLTKAERRVAESVAAGRTNKEVADHLFVSVKTVDFHLQGIYRKLSVRSRTELAVLMAQGAGPASVSGGTA